MLLLFNLLLFTAFTALLLVYPVEPLAKSFEVMPVSQKSQHVTFRLLLLAFPSAHLVTAVFIEVREAAALISYVGTWVIKGKGKGLPQQAEVAQGFRVG